jgi:cytochrome c oxidase cbb3-type subunit 3/ubiquinol-cytochrome c reductase cytochrome c subunit
MRALWALLKAVGVAAVCVAAGSLQCGGHVMTETEGRGATIYHRMCAVCHGANGEGYAADDAPAIANPRFLSVVSDHFLETTIGNGRTGTTMSAWSSARGGPLGYKEINDVVAYLRTFERYPHVTVDDSPPHADGKAGFKTYDARCRACHGDKGVGGPYVHIGDPDLLAAAGNGMLRETITHGRDGTLMPAFGRELGPDGVDSLVAALRLWQADAPRTARPAPPKPPPLPLGPVPLNPKGPEPKDFQTQPQTTKADIVKRELDRGARMALLDARAQSDYLGEHIKGAVSVPFFDPDPYISQLPRDAWLVCYCACPHAESGQLARKLVEKGFTKVTILDEGLGVWRARKYGTSSGIDP